MAISLDPVSRPRFYGLTTAGGTRYDTVATVERGNVLAATVVQTCIRYTAETTRCRFCTIEESLRSGATAQVKWPEELAEVTRAAVELDGITRMVLTTGTSTGRDRGAKHLARCVAAVRVAVPALPIEVRCEPPQDLAWIDALYDAGADTIGIYVEALDDALRRRWTPGKAVVSTAEYERAWMHAVAIFGRGNVSTRLLIGLGEDPEELIANAEWLIAMGVYPAVVPYRPVEGSLATEPPPDAAVVDNVTRRVAAALDIGHLGMEAA
ncbi:MAG: hypothetical protein QOF76_892 [Solirubrobacteraceae bacterium]|jgi:radical SAM protein (TIGR04043 family)|nr:hypothetical protein [Solirubrobacteraceae bacterium]